VFHSLLLIQYKYDTKVRQVYQLVMFEDNVLAFITTRSFHTEG